MRILASNPFSPDAASDWWNFGVNVFIGLATLAAVGVSLWQARTAQRDADRALDESQKLAKREAQRERQVRIDDVRTRAARQALSVWVDTWWSAGLDGAVFQPRVHNDSTDVLRDVEVKLALPRGEVLSWTAPAVSASSRSVLSPDREAERYGVDDEASSRVDFQYSLRFTDIFRDRWEVDSSRRVRLLEEARFELPSD